MNSRMWHTAAGVLFGVIAFAVFRLAFAAPMEPVHYHANFALFVNGARVDLSADEYMEEVGACSVGPEVVPSARAHLHANNPDVAHVHHPGVTWGHFLANLGFGFGEDYLAMDGGPVLTEGEGRTLKFILNGQPQFTVHNQLIRSGDRLLISYGSDSEAEVLRTEFPSVAANAEEFNQLQDPAGCAGSPEPTLRERLVHAFVG